MLRAARNCLNYDIRCLAAPIACVADVMRALHYDSHVAVMVTVYMLLMWQLERP